ncbi:MAG: transposase [Candidatus Omnitrophota bacterium]
MARPLRIEYPGAMYHVTSRGNDGQEIFKSDRDRERFLGYLTQVKDKFKTTIHVYNLMTNHYHLEIETPEGNLSKVMQYINSSYTLYYNTKRRKKGHLFQGRYKAILVEKNEYMKELSRYIHLNPIKAKMVERPEEYEWSSYRYYLNSKGKPDFLETDFILSCFEGDKNEYKRFVEMGITEKVRDVLKEVRCGTILGDDEFIKGIKEKYLKGRKDSEDLPALRSLKKEVNIEERIDKIVEKRYKGKEQKKIRVYLYSKYADLKNKEIIEKIYGERRHISLVSKIVLRLETKRQTNKKYNSEIEKLEKMSIV